MNTETREKITTLNEILNLRISYRTYKAKIDLFNGLFCKTELSLHLKIQKILYKVYVVSLSIPVKFEFLIVNNNKLEIKKNLTAGALNFYRPMIMKVITFDPL